MTLTFGSLFAGVGGIDLGFERSGMTCQWQVEIDEYAQQVLTKHWPDVRGWPDIRTFPPQPASEWRVDVIAGGFPCQDISYAGRGAGLAGERSGLFFEAIRVVQQLRPRYVILENVAALLVRGLDVVLGTLAAIGYDAEWHCISAASLGAPHIRDRLFILATCRGLVAYSDGSECGIAERSRESVGHNRKANETEGRRGVSHETGRGSTSEDVAYTDGQRLERWPIFDCDARTKLKAIERGHREPGGQWFAEPDVGRVAHGVSNRVDRLRGLGNAVVPQVAELIGRALVEFELTTKGQQ